MDRADPATRDSSRIASFPLSPRRDTRLPDRNGWPRDPGDETRTRQGTTVAAALHRRKDAILEAAMGTLGLLTVF